ncbi:unnamed protein product, partial [Ilex paraguariensis]
ALDRTSGRRFVLGRSVWTQDILLVTVRRSEAPSYRDVRALLTTSEKHLHRVKEVLRDYMNLFDAINKFHKCCS